MSKALRKFSGAILLWVPVVVGCFIVTMALAELYMLATGSKPGTPIFLDELAPTPRDALLDLLYGAAIITLPFLLRSAICQWRR